MTFADMYKIEKENNSSIDTTNLTEDDTIEDQQKLAKTLSDTNNDVDALANLNQQKDNLEALKANSNTDELTPEAVGFAQEAIMSTLRSIKYPEAEIYLVAREAAVADTPAIAIEGILQKIDNAIFWVIKKIIEAIKKIRDFIYGLIRKVTEKWKITMDSLDSLPDNAAVNFSFKPTTGPARVIAASLVAKPTHSAEIEFSSFLDRAVEIIKATSSGIEFVSSALKKAFIGFEDVNNSPVYTGDVLTRHDFVYAIYKQYVANPLNKIIKNIEMDGLIKIEYEPVTSTNGVVIRTLYPDSHNEFYYKLKTATINDHGRWDGKWVIKTSKVTAIKYPLLAIKATYGSISRNLEDIEKGMKEVVGKLEKSKDEILKKSEEHSGMTYVKPDGRLGSVDRFNTQKTFETVMGSLNISLKIITLANSDCREFADGLIRQISDRINIFNAKTIEQ